MSVKDWTNLKLIDTLIVETLAISTGQGANRVALEVHDEILLRLNQAQRPCSECATPSDKWSPVIAEAFKIQKVNMNCFKLYFFGSFLGAHHSQKSAENRAGMLSDLILKWTNKYAKLLTDELVNAKTECATLRKERDEGEIADAQINEVMGKYMDELEAAKAQLSTLRDALDQAIKRQQKITREGHKYCWACGEQNGKHKNGLNHAPCAAGEMEKIRAALAPTPEVAPESVKLVSKREPTEAEIKQGLELQPMAEECLKRNTTPEVAPKE